MSEPDLCRLRECALLGEQASTLGEEYASFAYHHWVRRHVEELLYEDLWEALTWEKPSVGRRRSPPI